MTGERGNSDGEIPGIQELRFLRNTIAPIKATAAARRIPTPFERLSTRFKAGTSLFEMVHTESVTAEPGRIGQMLNPDHSRVHNPSRAEGYFLEDHSTAVASSLSGSRPWDWENRPDSALTGRTSPQSARTRDPSLRLFPRASSFGTLAVFQGTQKTRDQPVPAPDQPRSHRNKPGQQPRPAKKR